MSTTANVAQDLNSGADFNTALKARGNEALKNLKRKAVAKMSGDGISTAGVYRGTAPRKKKSKQSSASASSIKKKTKKKKSTTKKKKATVATKKKKIKKKKKKTSAAAVSQQAFNYF